MGSRKRPFDRLVVWLLVCLPSFGLQAEQQVSGNVMTDLRVQSEGQATRIELLCSQQPLFTVFKLPDPDRLVVDLIGTEIKAQGLPRQIDDGRVLRLASARFDQAGRVVSRIIIGLGENMRFDAQLKENTVVVVVSPNAEWASANNPEQPQLAQAANQEKPAVEEKAPASQEEATQPDFKLVASEGDPARASRVRLLGLSSSGDGVLVKTSDKITAYQLLEVFQPFRLVVDIFGGQLSKAFMEKEINGRLVKKARLARHPDKVRIVFDWQEGADTKYRFEKVDRGFKISAEVGAPLLANAKDKEAPQQTEAAEPVRQEQKAQETPATAVRTATARVENIDFKQEKDTGVVLVELNGDAEARLTYNDDNSSVLEIEPCRLPPLLEKTLDVSDFGGALKSISAYRSEGNKVKLVALSNKRVASRLEKAEGKLRWVFDSPVEAAQAEREPGTLAYDYQTSQVAGYSVRHPEQAAGAGAGETKRQKYRGRRISLDFKDADIHNILRLIADVAKLNIITSDEVKGSITISLKNVPWDQALDIILKTKKLGMVREGNIIRVAPLKELAEEQKMAQEAAEAKRTIEPLRVRLIPVNYAVAGAIEKQVKDILSERGTVTVDERTNVLIVKDVLENLVKAEGLVRSLDTETPQVLIESRIVEANTQFARELGIQWGGDLGFNTANGNPTGLPFPYNMNITGGADDSNTNNPLGGVAIPGHYAVNLPAAVGAGSGGALGFMFGSANSSAHLNLRLSALENQGTVKIISAPKITTLDNQKAKIGQGVSIPISVVSAAGVNTQFVEARLELEVSPHITQQGSILLNIKVSKNEPDFSRTGARGDPTILRKEAETQVLVRDGDTTVIGGIYTRKTSETISGVPVLSQIPVLGWFFRNTKKNDDRTELLIFITPRIVNRLQATVSQR